LQILEGFALREGEKPPWGIWKTGEAAHQRAAHFCSSCHAPLCEDCSEEIRPGVYTCFKCGMIQSVSQVGTTMGERRERAAVKRTRKNKWGPFHYFLVVSAVLVLVMTGIIIFGGQASPQKMAGFAKKGRVFLFMVHGALKRYDHYEGQPYPDDLSALVPRYLPMKPSELPLLKRLHYQRDPEVGYRLSLAETTQGEMNVILTPRGVIYGLSGTVGVR
jgi:hypothetical protein